MLLKEMILKHEGLRLKPYKDTVGKLTIGVGRNLDDVGISYEEAMTMLDNDIQRAIEGIRSRFDWFDNLDNVRQGVVVDMVFNLGIEGFSKFISTIEAIATGQYEDASKFMRQSLWRRQVGARADELSEMMRTGEVTLK